jgi:hypothetical protein
VSVILKLFHIISVVIVLKHLIESVCFQLNQDCQNNGWSHIDGKLSMIEVATDGGVFGVNSAGQVYTR